MSVSGTVSPVFAATRSLAVLGAVTRARWLHFPVYGLVSRHWWSCTPARLQIIDAVQRTTGVPRGVAEMLDDDFPWREADVHARAEFDSEEDLRLDLRLLAACSPSTTPDRERRSQPLPALRLVCLAEILVGLCKGAWLWANDADTTETLAVLYARAGGTEQLRAQLDHGELVVTLHATCRSACILGALPADELDWARLTDFCRLHAHTTSLDYVAWQTRVIADLVAATR